MTPTKDRVRIAAAGQAAEWFIANQDSVPERYRRAAFVAWLKASPIHIEEYLGIALVAKDLRLAAADSDEQLESLVEMGRADAAGHVVAVHASQGRIPLKQYFTPVRRWSLAVTAVAAAVLIGWWTVAELSGPESQRYATQRGQQSLQRLADGSVLHMNTNTEVEVTYDKSGRRVQMHAGQAFFIVVHEDARQFQVTAGQADIVAVGTQFDVRLDDGSTVVTVVDGRVDVRSRNEAGDAPDHAVRVPAGHQLRIDGSVMPAQSERVDTGAAIAWRQHKIAFESQPLGDVADEFNRYGVIQIYIEDSELRALPISGVFNAYDADSFAAFLESLDDVRIERTPTEIRVMRQEAEKQREPAPKN
jgi:transmembrane sensor